MSEKLAYTNRKGTPYYIREVTGKRGVRIACSQKQFKDDFVTTPCTRNHAPPEYREARPASILI